jgi:uncharacterized protein HemX
VAIEKTNMKLRTKLYIGLAAAAIIAISSTALWQSQKIAALENDVADAKQTANEKREAAAEKELQAAEYEQKIDYLERQLADMQTQTRKQDEKLENLNTNSRNARGTVERAKRTRTIDTNTAELCAKLAELGHACG